MAPLATDAMVLLGQVGQVQKLVERPGNRKQFIIAQLAQQVYKPLPGSAFLAAICLGRRTDFLDQFIAILSWIPPYALAKQFAQHSYVFSEFGMKLSHIDVLLN